MSDIVERLRKWSVFGYGYEASCDMKEAATAIDEQRANMANAARLLSKQTARLEKLEAALRDVVQEASEHHAENISRAELGGSDMTQRKAKAIVARSGVLIYKIRLIARAALEEECSSS